MLMQRMAMGNNDRNESTCVYWHFDAAGFLLYVGMTRNPINRLDGHAAKSDWFKQVAYTEYKWFDSRPAAAAAEMAAIESGNPIYNRQRQSEYEQAAYTIRDLVTFVEAKRLLRLNARVKKADLLKVPAFEGCFHCGLVVLPKLSHAKQSGAIDRFLGLR